MGVIPSAELLLRHSTAGPRYTSYPTAPVWIEEFPPAAFEDALRRAKPPLSVYVHIPFCREQCSFCGCNMVVAGRREPGTRYLDDLEKRVEALPLAGPTVEVARIHLGGGTPTWLTAVELERLYEILFRRFRPIAGAELSVEADPEVTTDEQVHALCALGINRLSMGVQSFDPAVLAAVNRPQQQSRIAHLMDLCRSVGMHSLNLDLIYGLPYQSNESWADTIDQTLQMRPDRLAVFGYAHVPWLKPHMRKIPADALPGPVARMDLFLLAHRMLIERGYQAIGMDHFALPDDDLARAQREERLHRNFMGYTTLPDVEMVGIGMSAISELSGVYAQERSKLADWWRAVERGEPILEKGWVLTAEDRLRREVIERIMCNFVVPFEEVAARHLGGESFDDHFAGELRRLRPLEEEGLVQRSPGELRITELGRLLVRNVAMLFDPYLAKPADGPRYSQTV